MNSFIDRQAFFFDVGHNKSYESESFDNTNTVGTNKIQINIWPSLVIRFSMRVGQYLRFTQTHENILKYIAMRHAMFALWSASQCSEIWRYGWIFEHLIVDIIRSVCRDETKSVIKYMLTIYAFTSHAFA